MAGASQHRPPKLIGRDAELDQVLHALAHSSSLVLIEGEPGIGKTRLLLEVLDSPAVAKRTTLLAACPPLREPFPLAPVVEALLRMGNNVPDLELTRLGGALRPLFPEWAEKLPPALEPFDDPRDHRYRILRALSELLASLGVEILVVEDTHWADKATLEWLVTLTSTELTPGARPVSIILTYRPDDVPEGSLLRSLTARPPGLMTRQRVELQPLDLQQAQRMAEMVLDGVEVSSEFAAFLHEHTDGVPLALEEITRLMRDRESASAPPGPLRKPPPGELCVPATVRDSVLERVDRLPREARQVLRAAAVLGLPADEELLFATAGVHEQAGRHGVARSVAAGLLHDSARGTLAFRHVLDARSIHDAIPVTERWRLHRQAAMALEQLNPKPVVRLARHYGEAKDTHAWSRYAEASADVTWASGEDHTAVRTLLDLLTIVEHPAQRRVELAHKLGDIAFNDATTLDTLAEPVADALGTVLTAGQLEPSMRGEIRLLLGRALWRCRRARAALTQIEAAVPDLGHRPDLAMRATLNLALPLQPDWPADRHRQWLDRAAELVATTESSPSDRLAFQHMRATTLLLLGDDAGWQQSEVDDTVAATLLSRSEHRRIASLRLNVAMASLHWGRYHQTRQLITAATRAIATTDYQRLAFSVQVYEAILNWYTGAWTGLPNVVADLASSEGQQSALRLHARVVLGLLHLASGARREAEEELHAVMAAESNDDLPTPKITLAPAALARILVGDDAPGSALELTTPIVDMIKRKEVWLWATDLIPVHLDALVSNGQQDRAAALVRQFADGVHGHDAPAAGASVATCSAIMTAAAGAQERAAARFGRAARLWAEIPRPYDQLLTLERQGGSLLAAGHRHAGLAILTKAERRLHRLGARWDADRVAQLLRKHGVEVVRPWRRGRRGYGDDLSPRELRCLQLVAEGKANKEVAEALFISPRTVEGHLQRAMRKLNVSSRTALCMAAAEAGLLTRKLGQY